MKTLRFPFFPFYDRVGMERYLERMAKKGWMLEHMGNYIWTFTACTPKQVHFTVSYYSKGSAFDPELTEGQKMLEELCSHGGWKLMDSQAEIMVFASEEENPIPIHTESATELDQLEKSSTKYIFGWGVVLFIILVQLLMSIQNLRSNPVPFLASTLSLVCGITLPLLGIVIVLELLIWFYWRKKARMAVEQEEPLPPVRGCAFLEKIILMLFMMGIVWGLLEENQPGVRFNILLVLFAIVFLNLAVNGARLFMKKRKASKEKNMAVTLIVDVVMATFLTAILCWSGMQDSSNEMVPADDELILTAEELCGVPQPGATLESQYEGSVLITHIQGWDIGDADIPKEDRASLSYEIVDADTRFVYDWIFQWMSHRYDHYVDYEEWDETSELRYVYTPADAEPWDAEAVWRLKKGDEPTDIYLICWDDRILELETGWELSESQIEVAAAKFKPNR